MANLYQSMHLKNLKCLSKQRQYLIFSCTTIEDNYIVLKIENYPSLKITRLQGYSETRTIGKPLLIVHSQDVQLLKQLSVPDMLIKATMSFQELTFSAIQVSQQFEMARYILLNNPVLLSLILFEYCISDNRNWNEKKWRECLGQYVDNWDDYNELKSIVLTNCITSKERVSEIIDFLFNISTKYKQCKKIPDYALPYINEMSQYPEIGCMIYDVSELSRSDDSRIIQWIEQGVDFLIQKNCSDEYDIGVYLLKKISCLVGEVINISKILKIETRVNDLLREANSFEQIYQYYRNLLRHIERLSLGSTHIIPESDLMISENDWQLLPSGTFQMGFRKNEHCRGYNHKNKKVSVLSFYMLKTPVTFAMFDVFCQATGRPLVDDCGWGRSDRPVINVSYWDAVNYALWLGIQTGWKCALPSEAQWEYACRAGTQTFYSFGNKINNTKANYRNLETNDYPGKTTKVKKYPANQWGVYDMHGNVYEWCSSEYDPFYEGNEQIDATDDTSNIKPRVLRGGAWIYCEDSLHSASRYCSEPDNENSDWGFRLIRLVI